MDLAGKNAFANAGFSQQKHGGVQRGHAHGGFHGRLHGGTASHQSLFLSGRWRGLAAQGLNQKLSVVKLFFQRFLQGDIPADVDHPHQTPLGIKQRLAGDQQLPAAFGFLHQCDTLLGAQHGHRGGDIENPLLFQVKSAGADDLVQGDTEVLGTGLAHFQENTVAIGNGDLVKGHVKNCFQFVTAGSGCGNHKKPPLFFPTGLVHIIITLLKNVNSSCRTPKGENGQREERYKFFL